MGSVGANQTLSPQADLISTIGESAALGAAGAILWGDAADTKNRVSLGSVWEVDGWRDHLPLEEDQWLSCPLHLMYFSLVTLAPPFP